MYPVTLRALPQAHLASAHHHAKNAAGQLGHSVLWSCMHSGYSDCGRSFTGAGAESRSAQRRTREWIYSGYLLSAAK